MYYLSFSKIASVLLQAQMERKISEAEKDAALSTANAVNEKEREMTSLLRAADKENARLQARIELLEERIRRSLNPLPDPHPGSDSQIQNQPGFLPRFHSGSFHRVALE